MRKRLSVAGLLPAIAGVGVGLGSDELGRRTAAVPELVWVTPSGRRYHREDCRHARTVLPTPLARVRAEGSRKPCAVCRPPS